MDFRRVVVQAVAHSTITTIPKARRPTKKIFHGDVPQLDAAAIKISAWMFSPLLVIV